MYFTGSDGYQIFLAFLPMFSSIILDRNKKVTNWTSTGISPEKIKPFDTNLEMIMPDLDNGRVTLKFSNSVLVQKNVSALHSNFILNLYIVCEVSTWPRCPTNNVRLTNCLFGTDKSKFPDNGRGMPFDGEGFQSFDHESARNVVIFGVDNISPSHTDNRNNNLVIGERLTQGINDSTGAAENKFSTNFSKVNTKFCLSLH